MSKIFEILLFSSAVLFSIYISAIVWLNPQRHKESIRKTRNDFKNKFPFLPDWFLDFAFFNFKGNFSVWWGRIFTFIALIISAIGLWSVIIK